MINISCATREDMESSLEQMIVRCVAAYKGRVLKALKGEDIDTQAHTWSLPYIERVMTEVERDLHKSLKVEVSGANETLNDLIDGAVSH
jgi:hypothetical protein